MQIACSAPIHLSYSINAELEKTDRDDDGLFQLAKFVIPLFWLLFRERSGGGEQCRIKTLHKIIDVSYHQKFVIWIHTLRHRPMRTDDNVAAEVGKMLDAARVLFRRHSLVCHRACRLPLLRLF